MDNQIEVRLEIVGNRALCRFIPVTHGQICAKVHYAGNPQTLVCPPLDIKVYRNYPEKPFSMSRFDSGDHGSTYGGIAADTNSTKVSTLSATLP